MHERESDWLRSLAVAAFATAMAAGCGSRAAPPQSADEYYRDLDTPRTSAARPAAPPRQAEPHAAVLVRRPALAEGGLDGLTAGLSLYRAADRLRDCHGSVTGRQAARGVVYLLLDVAADGEVDGVLVGHSDVRDLRFMACVDETLRQVRMPASERRSVVQAHVVFGAADEDDGRLLLASYRAARELAAQVADRPVPLTAIRGSVQGCSERIFRGREAEAGRLLLEIGVRDDGRVSTVRVVEDDFGGRLDGCVITVVEKLRLELPPGSGPTLSYPVIFQAGAGSGGGASGDSPGASASE